MIKLIEPRSALPKWDQVLFMISCSFFWVSRLFEKQDCFSSLLNAFSKFFKVELEVDEYSEHSVGQGSKTKAASYIKIEGEGINQWGIGTHESITKSSINSILSVINNLLSKGLLKVWDMHFQKLTFLLFFYLVYVYFTSW